MIRFAGLDFLRGFGVVLCLVLTFGQYLPLKDELVVYWQFLLPLFGFVSGATLTVTALQRTHKHPWQLVYRWTFFHSLLLILVGLLGKWIFSQGLARSVPLGRTWGFLGSQWGFGSWSGWESWALSDLVTSLGLGLMVFGLVLRWVFRKDVEEHFTSHWIIMASLAMVFTFGAVLTGTVTLPSPLFLAGKLLFQGFFPVMLSLATLFWGGLLGLLLVTKKRPWEAPVAVILAFVVPLALLGFQALGANPEMVGWIPFLQALDLTFLFSFALIILKAAHPQPGTTTGWFRIISRPLRSFGRLPLTIFFLSPLTAMGLVRLVEAFGFSWSQIPFWGILLFGGALVLFWGIVLGQWKKVSYRGSPDWLVQYALRWTGKPSSRLQFLLDDGE